MRISKRERKQEDKWENKKQRKVELNYYRKDLCREWHKKKTTQGRDERENSVHRN